MAHELRVLQEQGNERRLDRSCRASTRKRRSCSTTSCIGTIERAYTITVTTTTRCATAPNSRSSKSDRQRTNILSTTATTAPKSTSSRSDRQPANIPSTDLRSTTRKGPKETPTLYTKSHSRPTIILITRFDVSTRRRGEKSSTIT